MKRKILYLLFSFLLCCFALHSAAQQPVITQILPQKAEVGATINLYGAGFSLDKTKNIVFFGAVMGEVQSVYSSGEIMVKVPYGADNQPITVVNLENNLVGQSKVSFSSTYENLGKVTFGPLSKYTAITNTTAVTATDLNGDGKVDFIVSSSSVGALRMFLNTSSPGAISFAPWLSLTVPDDVSEVKFADFDGDGKKDLAYVGLSNSGVWVIKNSAASPTSNPTFDTGATPYNGFTLFPSAKGASKLEIADINADGKLDLITMNYKIGEPGTISVQLNTSTSAKINFANKVDFAVTPIGTAILDLAIGDVAGDSKPDIVVTTANLSGNVVVFQNNSNSTTVAFNKSFANVSAAANGVALADLNEDGKSDLVVSSTDKVIVRLGQGNGFFDNETAYTNNGNGAVTLADVTGDGYIDIIVGNSITTEVNIFKNNPGALGSFLPRYKSDIGNKSNCVIVADADGDGKLDIASTFIGGDSFFILRNNQTLPASVTTLPASNLTVASATLSGTVKTTDVVAQVAVSFEVSENSDFGTFQTFIATTNPTVTLSDGTLTASYVYMGDPDKVHYYRIVATNPQNNEKTKGKIENFKLLNQIKSIQLFNTPNPTKDKIGFVIYQITYVNDNNLSAANLKINTTGGIINPKFLLIQNHNGSNKLWDVAISYEALTDGTISLSFENTSDLGSFINTFPVVSEAVTVDVTAPAVPVNLKAEPGNTEVRISWEPNTETDFDQYLLYWGTAPMPGANVTIPKGVTSFVQTGLANDTKYYYRIVATDKAGNTSAYSGDVDATPSASSTLKKDQNLVFEAIPSATYGDGELTLTATSVSAIPITFQSSDATIAKVVGNKVQILKAGMVNITAMAAENNEYAAALQIQPLTINPRKITVTAIAKTKKVGAQDPEFKYTFVPALVAGDNFTGSLTRGTDEGIGDWPILQGMLGLSGDYTLTYIGANLTIEDKTPQKITFNVIATKTYGDAPFKLTATSDAALTIDWSSSNTNIATVTSDGYVQILAAGNVLIYANQAGDQNFAAAVQQAQQLIIAPRAVTITADAKTKSINDMEPPLTYQITAGNTVGIDKFSGALSRTGNNTPGVYDIVQSSLSLGNNYNLSFIGAKFTVTAKVDQQINFQTIATKTYGDADFALTATINSPLGISYTSSDNSIAMVTGNMLHVLKAGMVMINAIQMGDNQYNAAVTQSQSLTIAPMPITITANPITKAPGQQDPTLTYQITTGKLVNGDLFKGELIRQKGEGIGSYAIEQGSLALNSNYTLSFLSNTFTISLMSFTDFKLEANNILTPNGDGKNDYLVIKNLDQFPTVKLIVFDRYGRILYKTDHYLNDWNGMLNGSLLAESTYYYAVDLGKGYTPLRGYITLIH